MYYGGGAPNAITAHPNDNIIVCGRQKKKNKKNQYDSNNATVVATLGVA